MLNVSGHFEMIHVRDDRKFLEVQMNHFSRLVSEHTLFFPLWKMFSNEVMKQLQKVFMLH